MDRRVVNSIALRARSAGSWLAIPLLVALLLVPLPEKGRAFLVLQDLAHVPLGAVLALVVRASLLRRGGWFARAAGVKALLAVFAFLCFVEVAQRFVGRDPSLQDLLVGTGGAVCALAWRGAFEGSAGRRFVRLFVGLAAFVMAILPSGRDLYDTWRQGRDLPILASFEDDLELRRWAFEAAQASRSARGATHGRAALTLALAPAEYPAATLRWPYPDWRGYEALAFDLVLIDEEPLDLILKIVDADHGDTYEDRFHAKLSLAPGPNPIRIPLADVKRGPAARTMDLGRIRGVQLFVNGLARPTVLTIDHLRLE